MTQDQREHLQQLLKYLGAKKRRVGPFRQEGIARTMKGIRRQLKTDTWEPLK
jgi:hypothetical protein